jgi:hypothetical protein
MLEFGSLVQFTFEKSASTELVQGMTVAIPPQNVRNKSYDSSSGLKHSHQKAVTITIPYNVTTEQ